MDNIPIEKSHHAFIQEFNQTAPERKVQFDPKPFKDNEQRQRHMSKIAHYLLETGYAKDLSSIRRGLRVFSSKEFQAMIQHLLRLYDPSIPSMVSFSSELPKILKTIGCPLADVIYPKELLSVGAPHSYPHFLAMLSWLTDMAKGLQIAVEPDVEEETWEGMLFDKRYFSWTFFDYACNARVEYLNGHQDLATANQDLERALSIMSRAAHVSIQDSRLLLDQYQQDLNDFKKKHPNLHELKLRERDLKSDIEKFILYCEEKQRKIEKSKRLEETTKARKDDFTRIKETLEAQIDRIEQDLWNRGLTVKGIDGEIAEAKKLAEESNELQKKARELKLQYETKQERHKKLLSQMDATIKEHNHSLSKLAAIPSNQINENELKLSFDTADPCQHFPDDFETRVIPTLDRLCKQYANQVYQMTAVNSKLREELEDILKEITDVHSMCELHKKVAEKKREECIERDTIWTEENARSIQLLQDYEKDMEEKEKMALNALETARKNLSDMAKTTNEARLNTEQRKAETKHRYLCFIDLLKRSILEKNDLVLEVHDLVQAQGEAILHTFNSPD
ncbi:HEC/Ndc80p family-domain-containing protein [Sporodiniella umbellata]|nr:HEC/Ndc80p family-domain-containing protein [Sporodiniella umbellata]